MLPSELLLSEVGQKVKYFTVQAMVILLQHSVECATGMEYPRQLFQLNLILN